MGARWAWVGGCIAHPRVHKPNPLERPLRLRQIAVRRRQLVVVPVPHHHEPSPGAQQDPRGAAHAAEAAVSEGDAGDAEEAAELLLAEVARDAVHLRRRGGGYEERGREIVRFA